MHVCMYACITYVCIYISGVELELVSSKIQNDVDTGFSRCAIFVLFVFFFLEGVKYTGFQVSRLECVHTFYKRRHSIEARMCAHLLKENTFYRG
jgi:hypothetical protein